MFDEEMLRWFWDIGLWPIMMLYWDVVNCDVVITFMIVSHTLHFEMELMLVEMACIGEFWDEGYALLMALLIGNFWDGSSAPMVPHAFA